MNPEKYEYEESKANQVRRGYAIDRQACFLRERLWHEDQLIDEERLRNEYGVINGWKYQSGLSTIIRIWAAHPAITAPMTAWKRRL